MSNKRIYTADAPPAFTRWLPMQLDDAPPPAVAEAPAAPPAGEPLLDYLSQQDDRIIATEAESAAAAAALAEQELQTLREETRQQAYAEGLEQGRQQGAVDAEQLQAALHSMQTTLEQLQNNLAPQVLALALDFARHILRSELQQNPRIILPLVQEMLQALPQPGGHPRLHLHPEDADLVREVLGAELDALGWKIVPDTALARGDCLIETHHGEMNSSLAARWQQLCDSLGQPKLPLDDEAA